LSLLLGRFYCNLLCLLFLKLLPKVILKIFLVGLRLSDYVCPGRKSLLFRLFLISAGKPAYRRDVKIGFFGQNVIAILALSLNRRGPRYSFCLGLLRHGSNLVTQRTVLHSWCRQVGVLLHLHILLLLLQLHLRLLVGKHLLIRCELGRSCCLGQRVKVGQVAL